MKLFLAVTDSDWFRFLRSQPDLDEANFWQPGGNQEFRALQPGDPFLFGLLLRSDIHRLFDSGYVTVTADHRVHVSRKLKDDFQNGEPYYPLDGHEIWLPPETASRPCREFREWHADAVFKG